MNEVLNQPAIINLPQIQAFSIKIDLSTQSSAYANDCVIKADNDLSATFSWLSQYTKSLKTYTTYKREATKLLLWLSYEAGIALKQLKLEHLHSYLNFLQQPPAKWRTSRSQLRFGKQALNWRPFVGLPSLNTINISIRAISALLNYLVQANYLRFNPLKLMKTKDYLSQQHERKYKVWERMLEKDEWQAVQSALNNMPETSLKEQDNKLRTQFLFAMLYFLGLRINEFASSSWNAFRYRNGSWWFFVRGKGDKLAHIPVNEQLLSFVKIYRLHLGKNPLPEPGEKECFIISKKTGQPLNNRQVYGLVKNIGLAAAKEFEHDPIKQEKLIKLSPHWLRHMFASHQDLQGTNQTIIMLNSRHNSLQTTKIYLHAEDTQRHQEIQKLSMAVNPKLVDSNIPNVPLSVSLCLNLTSGSVCPATSLKALLETIEQHVFKEVEYTSNRDIIELLQEQIVANKKFGKSLEIEYKLANLTEQCLEVIKNDIAAECNIRLFKHKMDITFY